jgi:hypothetical protein
MFQFWGSAELQIIFTHNKCTVYFNAKWLFWEYELSTTFLCRALYASLGELMAWFTSELLDIGLSYANLRLDMCVGLLNSQADITLFLNSV